MKKLAFMFVTLLSTLTAYAQFLVTPDGVVSAENKTDRFVTVALEGMEQSDIYKVVLHYLENIDDIKDETLNVLENEAIIFEGRSRRIVGAGQFKTGIIYFKLLFRAKDNTLRIDIQEFDITKINIVKDGRDPFIYDKNGNLKGKTYKKQIEDFFNGFIEDIREKSNDFKSLKDTSW